MYSAKRRESDPQLVVRGARIRSIIPQTFPTTVKSSISVAEAPYRQTVDRGGASEKVPEVRNLIQDVSK